MLSSEEAGQILDNAEQIYSAADVSETVQKMALDITDTLSEQYPLHVSRYNDKIKGGKVNWKVAPHTNVKDRVVLVLDDILDEGITLASIRERIMESGAKAFYSAVFANKDISKSKPITADFVGVTLPDRYVFGFGMDIYGSWRNLPAIYAVRE